VVQSDFFNDSGVATVVVVALTSNTRLALAPGNVAVSRKDSALPRPSVANVSQLLSLDKSLLREKVATLPKEVLERVDAGLRLVLAL
jgi:mRNA interferase MazF